MYGAGRVKIPDLMALWAARLAHAKREVRALVAALRSRGPTRVRRGAVGPCLPADCRDRLRSGLRMIVMATRGRGRVARWLLGSTAKRVIRSAPCPVLTVLA